MRFATKTPTGDDVPDTKGQREGRAVRTRCWGWPIDNQVVRISLSLRDGYPGPDPARMKRVGMRDALKGLGPGYAGVGIELPKHAAPKVAADCAPSLSHSGEWLLSAVAGPAKLGSAIRLGADIERVRPRRFVQIGAYLGWPSPSESEAHFYRRWTLAEALFKAGGSEGIALFGRFDHATRAGATNAVCEDRRWRWSAWWPLLMPNTAACVVVGIPTR